MLQSSVGVSKTVIPTSLQKSHVIDDCNGWYRSKLGWKQ